MPFSFYARKTTGLEIPPLLQQQAVCKRQVVPVESPQPDPVAAAQRWPAALAERYSALAAAEREPVARGQARMFLQPRPGHPACSRQ